MSIPHLIHGIVPTDRDVAGAKLDRLTKTLERLDSRIDERDAYNQRMFLKLLHQIQVQQESRCPSVLAIVPAGRRKLASSPYEVRLYCEEPGAWHRLPEPEGCYGISQPANWFRKFGPYLEYLLKAFKHAVPLVGPVMGIAVEKLDSQLKADCDLMKELASQAPANLDYDDQLDIESGARPLRRANKDADFRALEAMLLELDPNRIWGGLSRYTTPEGLTLYLCPEHLAAYRQPVPDRRVTS